MIYEVVGLIRRDKRIKGEKKTKKMADNGVLMQQFDISNTKCCGSGFFGPAIKE